MDLLIHKAQMFTFIMHAWHYIICWELHCVQESYTNSIVFCTTLTCDLHYSAFNNGCTKYPWGKKAFEKSWQENKPIFLSVGYSTCHWCHVMERESFKCSVTASFSISRVSDHQYWRPTEVVFGLCLAQYTSAFSCPHCAPQEPAQGYGCWTILVPIWWHCSSGKTSLETYCQMVHMRRNASLSGVFERRIHTFDLTNKLTPSLKTPLYR